MQLVDVGVRDQLAKLKVVVVVCCLKLFAIGLMSRQVKLQMLWVVTEPKSQVVEICTLLFVELELIEVVRQRQLLGDFFCCLIPDQFVDLPLVSLCGHVNSTWNLMHFGDAHDATTFFLFELPQ